MMNNHVSNLIVAFVLHDEVYLRQVPQCILWHYLLIDTSTIVHAGNGSSTKFLNVFKIIFILDIL